MKINIASYHIANHNNNNDIRIAHRARLEWSIGMHSRLYKCCGVNKKLSKMAENSASYAYALWRG